MVGQDLQEIQDSAVGVELAVTLVIPVFLDGVDGQARELRDGVVRELADIQVGAEQAQAARVVGAA